MAKTRGDHHALLLAALVGVGLSACDVPPDPTPLLEPTYFPTKNLTLVALNLRTLAAIRTSDGETLWTYHPPGTPQKSAVARRPAYLTCPPKLARNDTLLIAYTDRFAVVEADTGLERWTFRYRRRGERTLCPAIAADSGVLFFVPSEYGDRTELTKLGVGGAMRWTTKLPDIGPVAGAPLVNQDTGDIVVFARKQLVDLSPEGLVNWVHDRPASAGP